jgi:hypothetical protein
MSDRRETDISGIKVSVGELWRIMVVIVPLLAAGISFGWNLNERILKLQERVIQLETTGCPPQPQKKGDLVDPFLSERNRSTDAGAHFSPR